MELTKTQLLKLVEGLKDEDSVLETLKGVEGISSPFDVAKLTVDDYKSILEKSEGIKGYYTSSFDTAVSHAVENHDKKFMAEKFPTLLEEAIKAKSLEGLTPEQKEIAELKAWKEQAEKEKAEAGIKAKYSKVLSDKGIKNTEIIDLIKLSDNDETNTAVIDKVVNLINSSIQEGVKNKFGDNAYTPPSQEVNKDPLISQLNEIMGVK